MTRKDYLILATALQDSRPPGYPTAQLVTHQWIETRRYIIEALAQDNPHFNEAHFIAVTEES